MNLVKCDVCKKETKRYLVAGTGYFHCMELCYDCGASVLKILKKNNFKYLPDEEKTKK